MSEPAKTPLPQYGYSMGPAPGTAVTQSPIQPLKPGSTIAPQTGGISPTEIPTFIKPLTPEQERERKIAEYRQSLQPQQPAAGRGGDAQSKTEEQKKADAERERLVQEYAKTLETGASGAGRGGTAAGRTEAEQRAVNEREAKIDAYRAANAQNGGAMAGRAGGTTPTNLTPTSNWGTKQTGGIAEVPTSYANPPGSPPKTGADMAPKTASGREDAQKKLDTMTAELKKTKDPKAWWEVLAAIADVAASGAFGYAGQRHETQAMRDLQAERAAEQAEQEYARQLALWNAQQGVQYGQEVELLENRQAFEANQNALARAAQAQNNLPAITPAF
jgi:hypothetical protein